MQKVDSTGLRNYLYDKDNDSPIFETDENYNPVIKYIKGPRIDELISKKYLTDDGQWKTVYYLYDGLGSVRQLTDEKGKVVAEYDYLPFGEIIEAHGSQARKNPFAFQGREWDWDSGLYYFRARYMDPRLGRFTSKDPLMDILIRNQAGYMNPMGLSAFRSGCGNGCSSGWLSRDPVGEEELIQSVDSLLRRIWESSVSAVDAQEDNLYVMMRNDPVNLFDVLGLRACTPPQPPKIWKKKPDAPPVTVNGCSNPVPGVDANNPSGYADFTGACNAHDRCYSDCDKTFGDCNASLGKDLRNVCNSHTPPLRGRRLQSCLWWAKKYEWAVGTSIGQGHYNAAQNEQCACLCP